MSLQSKPSAADPLYIRLHNDDNVAIVVNDLGLPRGTQFSCGMTLLDYVPQGHKVALSDLAEDAPVKRYGEVIGFAVRPIQKGGWVDESLVRLPEPPALERLPLATSIPAPQPPLDG